MRKERKQISGYVENHHILPRCMGGQDISKNLVLLTPREHYFAHLLLYKAYPNNFQLKCALSAMIYGSRSRSHKALKSRSYQKIKEIITKPIPTKETLQKLYYKQNMSYKRIGLHFNVSDMTVCKWFKLYKLKAKKSTEYRFNIPDKKDLINKDISYLIKKLKVGKSTIYKWLQHYKISPKRVIGINKPVPSFIELNKKYTTDKLTIRKIAQHYNVSNNLVSKWLKSYNIKTRAKRLRTDMS